MRTDIEVQPHGERRVEGRRVLDDGDIVGVGSVKLTLRIVPTPTSTKNRTVRRSIAARHWRATVVPLTVLDAIYAAV